MKKLITIAALSATLTAQTFAGDREWATVGKVLTGVVVVQAIDRIVNPPTQVVYVQTAPVVQPVVVQPQPVVYVQPAPVVYYTSPSVIVYPGCPTPVYRHHHHYRR